MYFTCRSAADQHSSTVVGHVFAIALALLGLLAIIQLAMRRLALSSNGQPNRMLPVYRFLCVPATPRAHVQAAAVWQSSVLSSTHARLTTEPLLSNSIGSESALEEEDLTSAMNSRESSMRSTNPRTVVRLCQLSYSALVMVCCSFFHWQSVGEFGARLVAFPTLRPDKADYEQLFPVMVLLMATGLCAVPLILLLYLFVEHGRSKIEAVKVKQMTGGTGIQLSFRESLTLQLTVMFRSSCWWMATFVLLRKLAIVFLLALVSPAQVWMWLTMLNFLFCFLHTQSEPYERPRDNYLESLTLLSCRYRVL